MIRLILIVIFVYAIGSAGFAQDASKKGALAGGREEIDEIDGKIVQLINQRAAVVERIGKMKAAAGLPIRVSSREQEVLKRVAAIGSAGPLPVSRLNAIYSTLLEQMRDWENEQQHPQVTSETLLKTSTAWNGALYERYASGVPEISVLQVTIPPHQQLAWHTHPMPNVGFILSGAITVEEPDGKQQHFSAGEAIPETVNTLHRGIAGDQSVVLLVFYAGVKGMPLRELRGGGQAPQPPPAEVQHGF